MCLAHCNKALGEDHEGGEAWTEVAGRPREVRVPHLHARLI
jgi:hypothetical protein